MSNLRGVKDDFAENSCAHYPHLEQRKPAGRQV
jgi:hypothetical protein